MLPWYVAHSPSLFRWFAGWCPSEPAPGLSCTVAHSPGTRWSLSGARLQAGSCPRYSSWPESDHDKEWVENKNTVCVCVWVCVGVCAPAAALTSLAVSAYSLTLSTETMLFSTSVQDLTIQLKIPVTCKGQRSFNLVSFLIHRCKHFTLYTRQHFVIATLVKKGW